MKMGQHFENRILKMCQIFKKKNGKKLEKKIVKNLKKNKKGQVCQN